MINDWDSWLKGFNSGLEEAWIRVKAGYVMSPDGCWYTPNREFEPDDWRGVHDGKRKGVAPQPRTDG